MIIKGSARQCMVVEMKVVLWRNFLGSSWDLLNVSTVHICLARAQIQSLKSLRDAFENRFFKRIFNTEDEKKTIDSNIDFLRKFQSRNMFLNIELVYCRMFTTFSSSLLNNFLKPILKIITLKISNLGEF